MKNGKGLAVPLAGAIALAMLLATSAFAESRHQSWTRHGSSGHSGHSSGGHSSGHFFSPGHSSGGHFFSHVSPGPSSGFHGVAPRGDGWRGSRSFDRSGPFRSREFNDGHRFRDFNDGRRFRDFNDGRRFFGQGRIERFAPWRGGYRVWLSGWGYPFFVPYSFWDPFRFRIGLFIGLPAYYDPYGYYSVYGGPGAYVPGYYDGAYVGTYDGGRYDSGRYTSVSGTVQSVDLSSGIVTIEDSRTRRIVSALLPPRDNRVDDIRPGDFIELSGDWVRGHRYDFDADRLDRLDPRR